MTGMRLHDPAGNRLYFNAEERAAFLAVARRQPTRIKYLTDERTQKPIGLRTGVRAPLPYFVLLGSAPVFTL